MISADVNVLVYGFDQSSRQHQSARAILEHGRSSAELMAVFPSVLAGFLRVMTDRRVFAEPADPDDALAFVDALLAGPSVRIVSPGPGYWPIVHDLLASHRPRGADVSDVFLAAAALEQGVTWYSYDRGFARFRDLRWVNPADAT